MDAVSNWFRMHVLTWLEPPKQIEVIDIIQVALIAYFVYHFILWLKNTRAYTLLKGILLIVIFAVIANLLNMDVIIWLFSNLSVAVITAVIIIFQPELRRVLEQLGHKNPLTNLAMLGSSSENNDRFSDKTVNELVRASFDMGEVKTGALIVVEKEVKLEEYEKTGIPVDAVLTSQLLINIFEHNTPLHDGAVIVRGDRVVAATCYLPLTDNLSLSKNLGTRHRAGVGISEISDSLTIIVSEETGNVSYAMNGILHTGVSPSELREQLYQVQKITKTENTKSGRRGRGKNEKKSAR
ncbi:MAG TPA: TIGR00159 family protein [Candidatus Scatomonas merdigallinarum]|nr:TIGR00159 family protein [Candidatus Scatomonas merdigallinarum]